MRINKMKRMFEKWYLPNFSKEIFTISKQITCDPPVYKLKDLDGEELKGTFYDYEIDNVHYLVKPLGYPNKFHLWVPASGIKKI